MSLRKKKGGFKYYLAELLILVLGISLSFALNEYRLENSERAHEEELLVQLRDNLATDSSLLFQNVDQIGTYIRKHGELLNLDTKAKFTDSLSVNVAYLLSYFDYSPVNIAYTEMQSLGNSRIIQNKDLLKDLIALYNNGFSSLEEWTNADRQFVLNQMMPYIAATLPYASNFNFGVLSQNGKNNLMQALNKDQTKHLIQLNLVIKAGLKGQFDQSLANVSKLITDIDKELAKD